MDFFETIVAASGNVKSDTLNRRYAVSLPGNVVFVSNDIKQTSSRYFQYGAGLVFWLVAYEYCKLYYDN
jgi:hypothetical protein